MRWVALFTVTRTLAVAVPLRATVAAKTRGARRRGRNGIPMASIGGNLLPTLRRAFCSHKGRNTALVTPGIENMRIRAHSWPGLIAGGRWSDPVAFLVGRDNETFRVRLERVRGQACSRDRSDWDARSPNSSERWCALFYRPSPGLKPRPRTRRDGEQDQLNGHETLSTAGRSGAQHGFSRR